MHTKVYRMKVVLTAWTCQGKDYGHHLGNVKDTQDELHDLPENAIARN